MKKITASILSVLMMLSMVFSSSVFAANEQPSAWESFVGLFSTQATAATTGVEYRGHIENIGNYPTDGTWVQGPTQLGTVGRSLRLEGFWIKLTNKPANVNIQYRVHVQNVGWMAPVQNGNFAGTEGKSQRIEAIEISLVDDQGAKVTGYSVQYKGHIQDQGDTAWFADGQQLGTTGLNRRLEALEVKIVKTQADMTAYDAIVVKANAADEDLFTTASYAALTKALADNVVTADNTQAEVDAATTAITTAFDALVLGANMEAYDAAVLKAKAVVEADYTADSFAALTKALADNVVTKDNTQAEVDAAVVAINAAYDALVPVIKVVSVEAINVADGTMVALDGATNVLADKDRGITVVFSEAVKADTVNTNTFKLYKGAAIIPVTVTLGTDEKTVTVKPQANLIDNTGYKLTIGAAVQSKSSTQTVGADKNYSFTTGAMAYALTGTGNSNYTAGTVLLSKTATVNTGATLTGNFDIKYNKNIDPSTVNTTNVRLYNVTDATYVAALPTVTGATVTLNPEEDLVANKLYRVEVKGLKDLLAVDVAHETFKVTANSTAITASPLKADGSALAANARIWPNAQAGSLDGKTTILTGGKIYLSFNQTQALDASTITSSNITINQYNATTEEYDIAIPATVTYDATVRRATITPDSDLPDGAQFELAWTDDVKDEFGLAINEGSVVFYTYDITAPTVTGVQMKAGATGTFAAVDSGVTGVDETKTIYVKLGFSEAVGHKVITNGTGAATTTAPGVEAVGGGAVKTLGAGNSIMVVNAATGNVVNAPTAVFANSNKEVILTFTGLANNTTYTVLMSGKNGAPTGSSATRNAFVDLTDDGGPDNNNRMTDSYTFTFSTTGEDTTAPTVAGAKFGTSYTSGADLAGAYNIESTNDDIYVQFSEKIALTDNPITMINTTDAATYTQAFAAYGGTFNGLLTSATLTTDTVIAVTNATGATAGDIIKVTDGTNTAYGIVKSVAGNNITLVSPIGKAIAIAGSSVTKLAAVTVSDAATDAKTLKVDLATVNGGAAATANKAHKLTLNSTITDVTGNTLTAVNYTFTTASATGASEVVNTVKASANGSAKDAFDATMPATGISKATDVQITFNKAYDPLTVNSSTITVKNDADEAQEFSLDNTTSATVVTLDFTTDLAVGEEYTVTIDGVKDTVGNSIVAKTTSFVTSVVPTLVSSSIADGETGVDVTPVIELTFANANMTTAAAGVLAGYVTPDGTDATDGIGTNVVLETAAGATVQAYYAVSGNTLKLYPLAPLGAYTDYKVTVTNTVLTGDTANTVIDFRTANTTETATMQSAVYNSDAKIITLQYNVPVAPAGGAATYTGITASAGNLGGSYTYAVTANDPTKVVVTLGTTPSVAASVTQINNVAGEANSIQSIAGAAATDIANATVTLQ